MSTAGTYNYHPKVAQPGKVFYQMESGGYQPAFFFGGSQIPIGLEIQRPEMHSPYVSHKDIQYAMTLQGRGIHTTVQKANKIFLASHLKR